MTARDPIEKNEMLLTALEGPDMSLAETISVWVMQFLGFLLVVAGVAGGVVGGDEIADHRRRYRLGIHHWFRVDRAERGDDAPFGRRPRDRRHRRERTG